MELNRDFSDLLSGFAANSVRFLLVGGYALAFYGRPRATGDIDLWSSHPPRMPAAFTRPWLTLARRSQGSRPRISPGIVFQIGVAPNRIDVLTSVTGLRFSTAWKRRKRSRYGDVPISLLASEDFVRNKRKLGRARDLADIEDLLGLEPKKKPRRKRTV